MHPPPEYRARADIARPPAASNPEGLSTMSITRQRVIIRLIGAWCENVINDESYAIRVTLADVRNRRAG
jgi:hypothetical protein